MIGERIRPVVWIVEDNDANFELLEYLLEEAGLATLRARDEREFVGLVESEATPALVLLDVHLGSGSGLDLVRQMRLHPDLVGVPAIAVTAHAMRGDRERFLAAGCASYVSKPIEREELYREIARWVELAR